ncbi:hypothetical protein [Halobaculum rarum]|uniref:hypothetical protein n=1 Tax=Halobaculum rarum TaxID=3075122 RepID=UPI0032AEDFA0
MFNNDGPWENNPIDEEDPFGEDESEYELIEDDSELCDCDPEYKESQVVQKSAGASLGGIGGQMGDGTTVIICTNCGGRFYEEEDDQHQNSGFDLGI